ncbi:unnamed protein product [Paramecium sonneborni]|uniref:Uncharacterized protein n=1 Tax=Paramecium sonneborni TaxID=65129 RepID=A0A8S1PNX4_9CILI|nr:unnamed protein product [Paramecium sonneborni]
MTTFIKNIGNQQIEEKLISIQCLIQQTDQIKYRITKIRKQILDQVNLMVLEHKVKFIKQSIWTHKQCYITQKTVKIKCQMYQLNKVELQFFQILQHKNIIKQISHESMKVHSNRLEICGYGYMLLQIYGSVSQLINILVLLKNSLSQVILNVRVFVQKRDIAFRSKIKQVKISDFGCSRQNKENLFQSILQGSVCELV